MPGKSSDCTSLSSLTIDDDHPGVSIYIMCNINNNMDMSNMVGLILDKVTVQSRPMCINVIK